MLSFSISFWDVIKISYLAERPLKKGIQGETEADFTDNFNVKHWQNSGTRKYHIEFSNFNNPWLNLFSIISILKH